MSHLGCALPGVLQAKKRQSLRAAHAFLGCSWKQLCLCLGLHKLWRRDPILSARVAHHGSWREMHMVRAQQPRLPPDVASWGSCSCLLR